MHTTPTIESLKVSIERLKELQKSYKFYWLSKQGTFLNNPSDIQAKVKYECADDFYLELFRLQGRLEAELNMETQNN